ncbi:hypothetical protein PP509_gp62 [Gordonia phage MichaelScott]|uniref:Uncharacterized protein n=1 Tax=Gordonia phage MichaelScott TaxID=2759395 RepID=A0A7L7SQP6_9CAUD|nr:hypothetical protein PP509_gp62 [Gordonia phage MichaelScott]QOC56304.1 hypothetical protein SEA_MICHAELSCOTT_62 [Gordonia phage MichaelScott]
MTTPNLEQIIADHSPESVDRSRFSGYVGYCRCRFSVSAPTYDEVRRSHAAHVVAAIRDSGLTVIALPEPNSRGRWASSHSFSDPGYLDWSVGVNGSVPFARARRGKGPESSAAQDHADFGAAILAAAQVAERNNP